VRAAQRASASLWLRRTPVGVWAIPVMQFDIYGAGRRHVPVHHDNERCLRATVTMRATAMAS
jgi:hypothetical protein